MASSKDGVFFVFLEEYCSKLENPSKNNISKSEHTG
jgi:hypothetical protein